MCTTIESKISVQSNLYDEQHILSIEQNTSLELPFSLDEIKDVVFQSNPNKAPGPDGLPFLFYQQYWELVKDDIYKHIMVFYHNKLDLRKINHATICLIPKIKEAHTIQKFRPISLINCSFKIITKLLANRLAKVVDFFNWWITNNIY